MVYTLLDLLFYNISFIFVLLIIFPLCPSGKQQSCSSATSSDAHRHNDKILTLFSLCDQELKLLLVLDSINSNISYSLTYSYNIIRGQNTQKLDIL